MGRFETEILTQPQNLKALVPLTGLMPRIVEKPGFMNVRAVEVCTKAEIGRKARHIKPCSCANFQQSGFEKGSLYSSR